MTTDEGTPEWLPLSLRGSAEAATYAALTEGIPDWLHASLYQWVTERSLRDDDLPLRIERHLRTGLPAYGDGYNRVQNYWFSCDDEGKLELLDFLLLDLQQQWDARIGRGDTSVAEILVGYAIALSEILRQGGSAWQVVDKPHWGLERRVNEATAALVDLASSPSTDSARKIASAWNACYRQNPDYDIAYRDAVLAVEALVVPMALPNGGTLGTAIAHIRDTIDRWHVGGLDDDRQESGQTLLAMLKTLWHNQERHAGAAGAIRDVTQPEAEAAVSVAVTLVHWFGSGLVTKDS